MGTSAPPKNPPYTPIYQTGGENLGQLLFPTAMRVPESTSSSVIRPALSKPQHTGSGFYGKSAGNAGQTNVIPATTAPPQATYGTNPTYDEYIAYATRLLNPNLYRKT